MTTLAGAMLETAKLVTDVYEGTGDTALSTTAYVYDATMKLPTGSYNGGTLWSANANKGVVEIKTIGENKITVVTAQTAALKGAYSIADAEFPMRKLKQAILHVLGKIELPAKDETLSAASGRVQIYSGTTLTISNVRRVYLDDVRNYHWQEQDGYIYFDDPDAEGELTIEYMTDASVSDYDSEINQAVDMNYLTWSAAAFLWRDLIRKIHKDNPTAQELLNEAKVNEAEALRTAKKYSMRRLPRDPHLARW